MKTVTASEANRHFSRLLRDVAAGETVIVTSHGRPVVKLTGVEEMFEKEDVIQPNVDDAAGRALFEHLKSRPRWTAPKWTREELYEDEPYPETFR